MVEDWGKAGLMRRILSALILAALYIASAEAATITVGLEGCDYTSIQRAVDEADPGDTISVESGTYKENVIVDKSLVLRGKGSGDDRPVVDGNGVGSTVTLSADRITFEGLIVKNAGYGKAGIEVRSDKNYIRNNLVTANRWYGISISGSDENVISSNVVSANKYGIWVSSGSDGSRITQNQLEKNANGNAVDAGKNYWDGNAYDDLEEEDTNYPIGGGSNVDENPKALSAGSEGDEPKTSTITVTITIPTPIISS